ncbi:MAG TPA: hypothetical protein DCP36_03860 [Sporomusaceae bacterium]|uniref:hypothetical protein n=1 Tax=Anaerospora sp. TaxID=1960278 RepID=UPI000EC1AD0F|nr:hypothetical protein [Anaerospora sp.]HAK72927.1 hypothetical protein [Sporomusaceae bacterium]
MNIVEVVGQLADLKSVDYRNTLAISVLIDLFIDKGLITRDEFVRKAAELEGETIAEIIMKRRITHI